MDPSPSVTPRCELVPGDCGIYSDQFWILLEKYRKYEIGVGVYPYHPACMEAWDEGLPVACAAAIAHLYPDGTVGFAHWTLDPCSPKGWRLLGEEPAAC